MTLSGSSPTPCTAGRTPLVLWRCWSTRRPAAIRSSRSSSSPPWLRKACSGSIGAPRPGSGTWIGFAARATPTTWWISCWGSCGDCRTRRRPLSSNSPVSGTWPRSRSSLDLSQFEDEIHVALEDAVRIGLILRAGGFLCLPPRPDSGGGLCAHPRKRARRSTPSDRTRAVGELDGGRPRRTSVRCRQPTESRRRAAGRSRRESADSRNQSESRAKGQSVRGVCVGARIFCSRYGAFGRKRLE